MNYMATKQPFQSGNGPGLQVENLFLISSSATILEVDTN